MNLSQACLSTAMNALNLGGRALRAAGREPPDLSPDTLVSTAQRRAQWSDFGSESFRGPLERLVAALEREANLTQLGRLTVHRHLVSLLETALHLQHERALQPAVAAQTINAPVFIVGLPRSGTTLLHSLMAQDSATRAPLTRETMFPAGYPETPAALGRIHRRAAGRLAWARRFLPGFERIHPLGAERPEECVALMAPALTSALFHSLHRVPSYQDWFEADPQVQGFDMHHRVLQQLQSRRGTTRWVLKAPAHLFSLKALLARYPDAQLIQTHRDPLRAIPSIASLNTALRRAFSERVDPEEVGRDCALRWARALDGFLRERDKLPRERVLDVTYAELTGAPLAAVERIYAHLGWSLTPAAQRVMQRSLAANPKDIHGVHRYSLRAFGLDVREETQRFARYCDRFNIRPQVAPTSIRRRTQNAFQGDSATEMSG